MTNKKTAIDDQIRRAADLIAGRGRAWVKESGLKSSLCLEFSITPRQAARRIRSAMLEALTHRVATREDQIAQTLAMLDRIAVDAHQPAKERNAAIDRRIELLGLSPAKGGPDAPEAPAFTPDPTRGQVTEKATDSTDKGEKPDANGLPHPSPPTIGRVPAVDPRVLGTV